MIVRNWESFLGSGEEFLAALLKRSSHCLIVGLLARVLVASLRVDFASKFVALVASLCRDLPDSEKSCVGWYGCPEKG